VIAFAWDRFELGRRPWLRGRTLRAGGVSLHTNRLIAGLLFILLGASFVVFQGTGALSGAYDTLGLGALGFHLQSWVADHVSPGADYLVLSVLVVVGLVSWAARVRSRRVRLDAARSEDSLRRRRWGSRSWRVDQPATGSKILGAHVFKRRVEHHAVRDGVEGHVVHHRRT
jgi:hypothetical protein